MTTENEAFKNWKTPYTIWQAAKEDSEREIAELKAQVNRLQRALVELRAISDEILNGLQASDGSVKQSKRKIS